MPFVGKEEREELEIEECDELESDELEINENHISLLGNVSGVMRSVMVRSQLERRAH
jgi:hypothetical protein